MLATFASKLGPIEKKRCHLVSQSANRRQKLPIQSNYKGVCLFPQNEKKNSYKKCTDQVSSSFTSLLLTSGDIYGCYCI